QPSIRSSTSRTCTSCASMFWQIHSVVVAVAVPINPSPPARVAPGTSREGDSAMTDVSTEQETALSLAEEAYQSLREYVEAIPAEAMLRPGRVGVWSGKDLIVHIAAWEREAVRVVREVAEGK